MKRPISLFFLILSFSYFSLSSDTSSFENSSLPQSFLGSDGTLFVNEYYKLNWDKGEANAIYHYKWNEEPWTKFSEPIFPPISGWNEIHYFAEDQLGNKESEQKINLYVDRISPRTSVIWKNLPKSWNDVSVAQATNELRIRAVDDESGIESISIFLNGGAEIKVGKDEEWILQTKEEGKHSLTAYTIDNVKNISKKMEISWLVDSTPPTLSLTTSPGVVQSTQKSVCLRNTKIQIHSKDAITETKDLLWRKKGTEPWTLTYKIFDMEKVFPYDSQINLEFKARDFSGNETAVLEFHCEIDRNPPETLIRIQK
jgi:hypothetical protein